MDCAEFVDRLTALVADDPGDAARRAQAGELREHAASCPACSGASDLVTLASAPRREAVPAPDLTPEVWRRFDERLAAALDAERPGAGRRRALAAAAAAMLAAVVLIAGWRTPRIESEASRAAADAAAWAGLDELPYDPGPIPDLEELSEAERAALWEWAQEQAHTTGGGDA